MRPHGLPCVQPFYPMLHPAVVARGSLLCQTNHQAFRFSEMRVIDPFTVWSRCRYPLLVGDERAFVAVSQPRMQARSFVALMIEPRRPALGFGGSEKSASVSCQPPARNRFT